MILAGLRGLPGKLPNSHHFMAFRSQTTLIFAIFQNSGGYPAKGCSKMPVMVA
jgi:hypothetical protein